MGPPVHVGFGQDMGAVVYGKDEKGVQNFSHETGGGGGEE
jgi:hypothetical protein